MPAGPVNGLREEHSGYEGVDCTNNTMELTAAIQAVKNRELWQALVAECEKRTVTFKWVKAHSGIVGNERADQRTNEAVTRRRGK